MGQTVLQAIFFDQFQNWKKFCDKPNGRIRDVVLTEVEKMRRCGDITQGFRAYVCDACHHTHKVPFRCKGKFCPTCSKGESLRWSELVEDDIYPTVHRHVIFTIDEELRSIFLHKKHRPALLKGLMDEAANLVLQFFRDKIHVTPGVIAALHTFGSKLEFNPHVHMVVTMGGLTKGGTWKTYDYLPYAMFRMQWQTVVLKLIRRILNKRELKDVQDKLQRAWKHKDGFYVNAPKRSRTKIKGLLLYISRYMRRGPIALDRIVMYDGDAVMFKYKDKRTGRTEHETMDVQTFIGSMVRHIPDKGFHTIRRYGLYSSRTKGLYKKVALLSLGVVTRLVEQARELTSPKKKKWWSTRIAETFGRNPLECPVCGEYYSYVGMTAVKNGKLYVKYAKNKQCREYLEYEVAKIGGEEFKVKQKQEIEKAYESLRFNWDGVTNRIPVYALRS